jgi:acyl-CoA reductase-like NAD-dependent aldehyde dehydrogenase
MARSSWRSQAEAIRWNVRLFVDGEYRDSAADGTYNTIDPATEAPLCEAPVGDPGDVERAVSSARRCVSTGAWSACPLARRGEVMQKLADLIVEHKSELALLDCLEVGQPIQAALWEIDILVPALLGSWATAVERMVSDSLPLTPSTLAFNTLEPRGVVAAVTSWNFPVCNAVWKLGPALAAGNSVVLKPSEHSPSSALRIAELGLEAGLPEGALNVVPGSGQTVGEALALHHDVDLLSFTGSTATGRRIMELAGRSNGKPVMLECGGKSPHVVFADAENLEFVAETILQEALFNQGQQCSVQSRVIADSRVKGALVDLLVSGARNYIPASPLEDSTTFGPLASPAHRDRVRDYIAEGRKSGARLALEGTIQESGGCYVSPTIFDGVTATMPLAQRTVFGPVLSALTFESEEEAVALANATDYALATTVWTRDLGRARRTASAIRSGAVTVRTSGEEDPHADLRSELVLGCEPQKASGFGAELGLKGIESYSTLKVIFLKGA